MGKGIELVEPEAYVDYNTYDRSSCAGSENRSLQQQQTHVTKSTAAMVRHVILLILFT